jgi:ubiquinone/menaquinone biosynthesis C-methylase UbiE
MASSTTFYASDGNGYEAQMGRWSRRLAPLFIDFAGVRRGRVLDVGCGTGSLTFALAQCPEIERVHGVDYHGVYIDHAKRHRHPRVNFAVGDACALHFADASFDHAVSSLALQFVTDPDQAVREMRRVTKPGGTVAAMTWDTRGGLVIWRMFFDTAAVLDPRAGERRAKASARLMSQAAGLEKAWRQAGLLDVVHTSLTIRMDFASFADFWEPFDGRDGPYAEYVSTLTAEEKSRFRSLLRAAYVDGETDGPRSYAATAWAIKGRVP